jgi:D-glycerate 3-kinase
LNNRAAATMVFGINVLKCWNKKQPSAVASDGCEKETKDTDAQIVECICSSPLLTLCQIDEQDVKERLEEYKDVSNHMIASMGMPQVFDEMSPAEQKRVYQYYLPVYMWCQSQLLEHEKSGKNGGSPLVLGISAPQGCGKSTLCEQLEDVFKYKGWVAASISIDDFYLTRKDQVAVAAKYNGNRLLEMRGNAGSHDVDLGTKTLKALKKATKEGSSVALPRYDKSAFQGKGDRSDPSTWPVVQGPVDVVLFEGWMLGFAHVPKPAAVSVDPDLEAVNGFLKSYKRAWDSHVDSWLVIKVADPQFSYTWRLQAEKRMRESGRPAMTDEEVATFVDRFMPAYKCYLPGLYKDGPTTSIKDKLLMIEVDQHRNPLEKQ